MLALGANIVNMGLSGTIGGFLLMRAALRAVAPRHRDIVVFAAAWFTVVATSALVSLELTASGTVPLVPSLVAMVGVHAVIGLIEGAVTEGVIRFLERVRPEVLENTPLALEAS